MKGLTTIDEVLKISADINIELPDELQGDTGMLSLQGS